MKKFVDGLVELACELDKQGLRVEADLVDSLIKKASDECSCKPRGDKGWLPPVKNGACPMCKKPRNEQE